MALLAGTAPADSPQVVWSLEGLGLIFKGCAAKSRLPSHLLEPLVFQESCPGSDILACETLVWVHLAHLSSLSGAWILSPNICLPVSL